MANPHVVIVDSVSQSIGIQREREVLSRIGATVSQYSCLTEAEIIPVVHGADALMVMRAATPITAKVIAALHQCKVIARYGVGVDGVDVQAAKARGIIVTNVPHYCVDEVSSHAMALLLACARRVVLLDAAVRRGSYDSAIAGPIYRLAGSTVGLVGLGQIGQSMARKLKGFDVRILACDPFLPAEVFVSHQVEAVDLDSLLRKSDYVSLHMPLSPSTHHLMSTQQLALMKSTAYLINTSRGGLVDLQALLEALRAQIIAGAALDVLEQEPPTPDHPLLQFPNVILTPHASYYSEESLADLKRMVAEDVVRVLSGQAPRNPV